MSVTGGLGVETDIGKGEVFIGAAYNWKVQMTDDGLSTGTPVNVSANAYTLVVRDSKGQEIFSEASPTFEDGSGTNDVIIFAVTRADTLGQNEGWYDYAVWQTDTSNEKPVASGRVYLSKAARY